jgi:NAD(P)-dependent dehydrogenase (short-subunit alcohol dehydrogenase family)
MTLFDLTGKVCVVTGATKGIGRAIAERFAEHGAQVVVASRTRADCDAVAAQINARWGEDRAIAATCDVSDISSVVQPIEAAVERWGKLDTVVGNAAAIAMNRFDAVELDEMQFGFEGNVKGNLALAKAAVPHLREAGGGSIMFTASTLGLFPSPPFLSYGVSKAALLHMVKTLACELGPQNIRVNALCPGIIATAATGYLIDNPALMKASLGNTPLGRIGQPDEIAACAVLLASAGGAYINGHVLVADGGQSHQGREAAVSAA